MLLGARMIWFCSSQLLHRDSWVLGCFVRQTICCFDYSMDTLRRFYCNHSCWLLMHYLSSIMYFLDTVVAHSHIRCFPITGLTKRKWPFYPDLGYWEPPHQTNRRPNLGVNTILHLHEGHNWHLCTGSGLFGSLFESTGRHPPMLPLELPHWIHCLLPRLFPQLPFLILNISRKGWTGNIKRGWQKRRLSRNSSEAAVATVLVAAKD